MLFPEKDAEAQSSSEAQTSFMGQRVSLSENSGFLKLSHLAHEMQKPCLI